MISLISAILATIVFFGYVGAIIYHGVYDSISDSYYMLKSKEELTGKDQLSLYFTTWCSLVSLLILYPLYTITMLNWGSWFVLPMCLGFLIVGASPNYTNSTYRWWHVTGACIIGLCALVISISAGLWYIMIGSLILAGVIQHFTKKDDVVMCVEVSGGFAVITIVLIKLIILKIWA